MQDLIITWKVSPAHVFGVDCDVLHVADPEADEREEGSSSLAHSLLPAIVPEHFGQLGFCLGEHFILLYDLVEVVLPVEHEAEGCLAVHLHVLCRNLIDLLFEAELSASPLFNLWVVCAGNGRQNFVAKLGDSEVGIGAEEFSELSLALVSVGLEGLKCRMEQVDHQRVVGHRYFFLSLEEL